MSILTDDKQFLKDRIPSLLRERCYTTISPDVMHLMKKAYAAKTVHAKYKIKNLPKSSQ